MASLGDLTLFVSAETKRAQQDIQGLGREADNVVSKKREFDFSLKQAQNNIKQFKSNIEDVGKAAKLAYKVAKMEGVFDDEIESAELLAKKTKQVGVALNEARKPGELLNRTFKSLTESAVGIVNALARVGFALYGIQQITGVLKQAFGGLFSNTVGRAVRLEESILRTQTALVSTNDILRNGQVIEDPLEAIGALTKVIESRIESIRIKTLELAGVTSGEVIEVFGIVASQAGQIGASLEEAEDLAIKFAAALGTFGLPMQQARQEIGSILRGDVGPDSYLAKSLGIRSEDIKKARSEVGGIVEFVNKKLEAAAAGQAIAAKSFSGVASNIADFGELIGEAFGKPLVQPLIDGLTVVYNLLDSIKDAALGGASVLGSAFATSLQGIGGIVTARTQISNQQSGVDFSKNITDSIEGLGSKIEALFARIQNSFSQIILLVGKSLSSLAKGFSNLASAFIGLNVGIFETLLETLENLLFIFTPLIQATGDFVALYGEFLRLPIIQTLSNIGGQFQLMERLGVNALIKITLVSLTLIKSFGTLKALAISLIATVKTGLIAGLQLVASALGALQAIFTPFVATLGVANPAVAAFVANLQKTAVSASTAATGLKTAAGATALLTKATVRFLKFNIVLLAVTVGVAALIEAFNKFRRAREKAEKIETFTTNLQQLNTTLSATAVEGDAAKEALRSIANLEAQAALNMMKDDFIEANKKVITLKKNVKLLKEELAAVSSADSFIDTTDAELAILIDKLEAAQKDLADKKKAFTDAQTEYEKLKDKERLADEITTRRKNFGQLTREQQKAIEGFNEAVRRREFSAQQELQRRRIALFQAEEEFKIKKLEARNRKLIKGEEGASAAALTAFNEYIAERERGELNIETQKRELVIANANVEEQIANYKYDLERKIAELKKKGLEMAIKEAELKKKEEQALRDKVDIPDLDNTEGITTSVDLGLASADGFADAKRVAQGIAQQILTQQTLAQGFVNQQNLDKIVEQLLPKRQLEPFKDSIERSSALLDQLGKNMPLEATKINAEMLANNAIAQREITETLKHLREELKKHPEIYKYLEGAIYKAYNGKDGILDQLRDQATLQSVANEKQRQANVILGLRESAQQGTTQTNQNIIAGRARIAAGLTLDLSERSRIQAQARIDQRFAQMQGQARAAGGQITSQMMEEFQKFSETELFNAERQAEMDGLIQRFNQLSSVAAGVGDAISNAFTNGFADIIRGTASVQDVLSNMFENIGQSFMKMAQKIIADMIKMLILKTMLKIFGGSMGGGGSVPSTDGLNIDGIQEYVDSSTILSPFAKGGIVTGPTAAMIGEGGMNEAVVPLPNGKAIPVDFGRNAKMGGDVTSNVTVNIDSSGGSKTEMSSDDAGKLGKAIDVAVKRVIMEERRSGGLLYNGRR